MQNKKTAAVNSGYVNLNELSNYNQSDEKTQQVFNFGKQPPRITVTVFDGQDADGPPFRFTGVGLTCDECCLPLYLYGENYIEVHANGRAYLLKALCNSHADEFRGVQK
jgi:hypothetical protein